VGVSENLPVPLEDGDVEPMDTSFEIALDDEPDGIPAPVHEGDGLPMPAQEPALLPVLPMPLRSVAVARSELAMRAGIAQHHVAYHGVRTPFYVLTSLVYAVFGAGRLGWKMLQWWWVAEAGGHRKGSDTDQWLKVHSHVREVRKTRGMVLLGGAGGLAAACALLATAVPWWGQALACAAALPALAWAGKPKGKPIVTPAVTKPRFRLLSADVVLRAYYAAKLGDPDKKDQQVTFAPPGMARDGDGSRVLVDLPYGKGLDDAVKAKGAIASGLDVTVSQVFLHRDPSSHRRHVLWVADRDPLAVPVGRTPLLACRQTDIWKPAPMGLDERGQLVELLLMWISVLVSALPRQGKTFAARLLALYAALDPYVKLDVFDFKGSPDWRKFALVANSYGFGLAPTREGLPLDTFLSTLVDLKRDVQERYAKLSELPPSICPEGKLTREIARDPQYGMPVRMLVLDEFQEVYDLGDDSKEIASLLTFLVKVAPAAGVILLDSTQRPSGVGSGQVAQQFTSFRDNHAVRFGLRTSSWQVSELCLGAGAYSEGLDTSTLLAQYKGVGILRGASDASPTVRTFLADGGDAEKILTAARRIREQAGTLSGMAAGEDVGAPARDVLADVLQVFGSDPGLQWQILAARLDAQIPDRWADTSPDAVSAEVRGLGVPSVDVKQFGRALKGCRRADVEAAARKGFA
jgi:S-DNA-T family DNA segregation ATPase FtsK/SpoIIIE